MNQALFWILRIFAELLRLYSYVMFAQAIMSWFVQPTNRLYIFLRRITEPFVGLFRPLAMKLTSRMGIPIDLAFLFAVIALQLVAGFVQWILNNMLMLNML